MTLQIFLLCTVLFDLLGTFVSMSLEINFVNVYVDMHKFYMHFVLLCIQLLLMNY